MLPANPRLGLIGFGEVGFNIAKGLKGAGIAKIIAYANGPRNKPPYHKAFKQKANAEGVELAATLEELAQNSDLIFSVIFPKGALSVTRAIGPFLTASHLYVDMNSTSPQSKRQGWAYLNKRKVRYVDAVLMGGPIREQHHTQIFASGEGASEFRDVMNKYGMEIRCVSDKVGDAAILKMIHSVMTKGISALLLESFMALYRSGLEPGVYDGLRNWVDQSGIINKADRVISHAAIHAERRTGEMEYVAETLRSLNIEPTMTRATIKRLAWLASYNLADRFCDRFPSGYKEVFTTLDKSSKNKTASDKGDK